ncbi:MAG: hypothetical protein JRK26_07170 [Deltaproteobacteria bacterium]|nr:hypothetical protein [Deltaproteobacteria bacterium]
MAGFDAVIIEGNPTNRFTCGLKTVKPRYATAAIYGGSPPKKQRKLFKRNSMTIRFEPPLSVRVVKNRCCIPVLCTAQRMLPAGADSVR